jgi:micrococcal nuclease
MPSLRTVLVLLVAVVAAVLAGTGGVPLAPGPAGGEERAARVARVVDGDTIQVDVDGRRERVRYIGVDTPESVKPGTPVECYAKRAAAENERLVAGERVRLVQDAEARDRYGRLLAYVYRASDDAFVNAALVRGGYARPLTIAPNDRHAAQFDALARDARRAGRGLWGACRG